MSLVTPAAQVVEMPPPERRWSRARLLGHALLGVWSLLGLALVVYLVNAWDAELFARYAPSYAAGLIVTIELVGISVAVGAVLSLPIAYARMSSSRLLSWPAYGYVYFFRGTPMLAQAFLVYYGLGQFRPQLEAVGLWGFFREAWWCAILAFTLNTSAYQAEIVRGAVESVPRGQWEGAASLGLRGWLTLRKIVAPQALIVALRPYGNEIILMIKGSAIVAIITVYDLMGETRRAFSRTFDFQTYVWAAIIYLVLVEVLRIATDRIERAITRHLRR